jgi:predicted transposase YdaD
VRNEDRSAGRGEGNREGRTEGRIEGRVEGKIEALIELCAVRGIALAAATRDRIARERDLERLGRWIARALTAATADEVFGDEVFGDDGDAPTPA